MFYKGDWQLWTALFNVDMHLKNDWDFLMVVSGEPGTGKSRFALQLLESWYKVVRGVYDEKDVSSNISSDFKQFVKKVGSAKAGDCVVLDEGSFALDSGDAQTVLSKRLSKLYDVIRYKNVFTVVVLPKFFYLNKRFRESRVRSFVHINKRGRYRWFSMNGIYYLNGYNEKRNFKSLFVARPLFNGVFPDYKGSLLSHYLSDSEVNKDNIVAELVEEINIESSSSKSLFDLHASKVLSYIKRGKSYSYIADKLSISKYSVYSIVNKLKTRTDSKGNPLL